MVAIKLDGGPSAAPPPTRDGVDSDRCPVDGTTVEPKFRLDSDPKGAHQAGAIFHHDPTKGGCGLSWPRSTSTGAARDRAKGIRDPQWKAAGVDRFTLSGSALYRANYDCAFLKCGCVFCIGQAYLPATRRAPCPHCGSGAPLKGH